MKTTIFSVVACLLIVAATSLAGGNLMAQDAEEKTKELKVGDKAPDWKLKGSDGKTYQLSKYKGKKAVVVSWYPMALTGG